MNFYASIEKTLKHDTDRELLTDTDGQKYTRRDIDAQVARLASYMVSIGIKPGDRVSAQVHKSVMNLCLYLACLRAGFVFHPLNAAYQSGEIEYFLGNAEPSLVVCDPEKLTMMRPLTDAAEIKHLETMDAAGNGSLTDKIAGCSEEFATVPRGGDDMAALLYSSGTTGLPKGIMLSHDNLRVNAECLVDAWGFTDADRLFHCLPIFHVHGLFVALGCVLLAGGTMRWAAGFDPKEAIEFLPECTSMMGVPTYYTRLLSDPDFSPSHCSNIRLFISGSAPLLAQTHVEFEERTNHIILERYGMTETGMNCSNPLDGKRKPGSVGPALPGVTARVVDDHGEACAAGDIGNLQVKGGNVFMGYWRMPEKTAEDFTPDGFFNTGDQATEDSDGYFSIVGRCKDMVITGGLNVYPKEVEDTIGQMSGVSESAVIGVPHPDFGEAIVAVVVTSDAANAPNPDDIIAFTKDKLANFKVPKHVSIADVLPRNTMGKVQKKALREKFSTLFE